jgi:hypothetical protein
MACLDSYTKSQFPLKFKILTLFGIRQVSEKIFMIFSKKNLMIFLGKNYDICESFMIPTTEIILMPAIVYIPKHTLKYF